MKKSERAVRKIIELEDRAQRTRYVYFIRHDKDLFGWVWELVGPADETIATSPILRSKTECVKSLRANQRHAAQSIINDHTK